VSCVALTAPIERDREAHLPTMDGDAYEKAIKLLVCDTYEPVFSRMLAVLKEDKDAKEALWSTCIMDILSRVTL